MNYQKHPSLSQMGTQPQTGNAANVRRSTRTVNSPKTEPGRTLQAGAPQNARSIASPDVRFVLLW